MIYNYIIHRTDASFETKIVDNLPSTDKAALNTIYFIKSNEGENNSYVEYLCIEENGARRWEIIGTTAVNLSDYVKKTDIKPLYVHNITLHYKHLNYPGGGDGECRASFILINAEATPYTLSATDATTAANYSARYALLRLFRAVISETNEPTGLTALRPYPNEPNSKNHLIPCSGVTVTPNSSLSYCINNHVGAKYFKYSDGALKRLLIIYGYPITGSELTAGTGSQSALELSCGLVSPEADGTDAIFYSDDAIEEVATNSAANFTGQYVAVTDLTHRLSII